MPHLTLEYTGNISKEIDPEVIFSQLHNIMKDIGGISIDNCKSRAIRQEHYFIGSGEKENAFIHLDIRFLEGRTKAIKRALGENCMRVLLSTFEDEIAENNLQITVEVSDINKSDYFKFPEGTL
jgi:5-carboxymethyl-2-hydroxymuconate isomerase